MAFLGHIVSVDAIIINPAKVEAITKWLRLTTVTQVRSCLGLARYYRRFVEGFSLIALPLTKLMRKGEKFVWNEEQEKSFEELKRRLISSPVLTLPSRTCGYQIYSDASKKGLGCVLFQHGKFIAYASRQLKPYEYHPAKAIVVTDALGRKNSGIIACLKIQPKIIKDLELMEIELVVCGSEVYIASLKIEPNLILRIKEAKKKDELWLVVQNMKKGKHEEFWVDDHVVIWYGNRLCVLDDSSRREFVLTEAHSSPFSIHPGSTKMYIDLKKNFWWNELDIEGLELIAVMNEKVVIAKEKLKEARSGQKSYADRRALKFKPGIMYFLRYLRVGSLDTLQPARNPLRLCGICVSIDDRDNCNTSSSTSVPYGVSNLSTISHQQNHQATNSDIEHPESRPKTVNTSTSSPQSPPPQQPSQPKSNPSFLVDLSSKTTSFQFVKSTTFCKKGKQHKVSYKAKLERIIIKPLELLHMDLFGPVSVESINKKRCDNGTEFKNHDMNELCAKKGIKREFSMARTPQQNGVAKRKNRTLIEVARTMLADLLLPIPFWAKAVNTACYVLNRVLVTKPQNKTPYELLIDSEDVADKEGQHQMTKDEQVLHDDLENMIAQEATSTNKLSTVRSSISTATTPYVSAASTPTGANAGESSFVDL
ncbi:retrotransposon protein, putative, ty3-gypsy subclass [Tanacetum coccineum]